MSTSPRSELRISIRLGFWGLALCAAWFALNLLMLGLDGAGVGMARPVAALILLSLVLTLTVCVVAAYRLARALGHPVVVRAIYGVLMLLPFANFMLLWNLRDRGLQRAAEGGGGEANPNQAGAEPAPSLGELVADARILPEAPATWGRFARSTLLTLGLSGGLGAALLAVFWFSDDEFSHLLSGFLGVVNGAVVLAALIKTATEACAAPPPDRSTPERAVESYMNLVNQRRWPEAMSCLSSSVAHGATVLRPAIPDLDLAPAAYRIRAPEDLCAYWSGLDAGPRRGGARSMNCQVLGVDYATRSSALVRVRFSLELDLANAEIGGDAWKRAPRAVVRAAAGLDRARVGREVCFPWPAYRRHGRWCLLQVGLPGR
jgi:hypothetical protein